jgi:microcystin degradation protein MlrC
VVVKSATVFREEYRPFAAKIITVDTPGVSSPNVRSIPFRHVSRPIYPLDKIESKP